MGLAWGLGYHLSKAILTREKVDTINLPLLFLGIFIMAWIGAKSFFLIFSAPEKISQYMYANYFWLGGGFVFYGGLIFGLSFYLFFTLILKKFSFSNSHLLIPGLVFGHAIGRIGCFLTGCCYGSISQIPWAIHTAGQDRHPVQLYEALGLALLGIYILKWINAKVESLKIIARYFIAYSLLRFVLEFFRGDDVRGIYWWGMSTSQIVSITLLAAGTFLIVKTKKNTKRSF